MIIWFFGQPSSGKTTLSNLFFKKIKPVYNYVFPKAIDISILDGDFLRSVFQDKGFDKTARQRNIQRAMDIAIYENHIKGLTIAALVTPYNEQRLWLQNYLGADNIVFVYLKYNTESEKRGKELFHVEDFEQPEELVNLIEINTTELGVQECADKVYSYLIDLQKKTKK